MERFIYKRILVDSEKKIFYCGKCIITEAAKSCGLKVGDTISVCFQEKHDMAGGYYWEYIEVTDNKTK